jgi:hypothetical protein
MLNYVIQYKCRHLFLKPALQVFFLTYGGWRVVVEVWKDEYVSLVYDDVETGICVSTLSFMYKPTNAHFIMWFSYTCLLFLAPACFGHSCDHLRGVTQCKYQKYNRNHMKYTMEPSKILFNTELENFITYFVLFLLYFWYLYCVTPWRWSQEWPKHADAENKRRNWTTL